MAPRHITVTWSASRPTRQKPTRHLVTLPATPTRTDRLRRESRERREPITGGGARLLWIAATAASSCEPMTCGGARLLYGIAATAAASRRVVLGTHMINSRPTHKKLLREGTTALCSCLLVVRRDQIQFFGTITISALGLLNIRYLALGLLIVSR